MKKNKKNKKNNKFFKLISFLLLISAIVSTVFIIYFEILPVTYISLYIIGVGIIVFFLFKILNNRKLKKWIKVLLSFPSMILIVVFVAICFYSYGTLDFLSNIFDSGIRTDTYSVYVLKSSKYNDIKELNDRIIGVSGDDDIDKAISKLSNKISFNKAEYDSIDESLDDIIDGEIDAMLALDNNIEILKENDDRYNDLKAIYTFNITTKVKTLSSTKNVTKENFVIYISGVDTSGKVDTKARSDVNLIVAVNPSDNKILMVNTPRDYYVLLHSKKAYDKLTHAGVYGIEESYTTLEDLYDIKVDYYARINFTTFINIVEKLDGIKVDVPINFCEQTSSRTSDAQICLNKGLQTLNGEEALALARTRYTVAGGDRGRIENQMLVLESIIDKAMSPNIIVKYNSLLSSVSDSLITNMNQKTFSRLIKEQIRKKKTWDIETYSVDGSDSSNKTYSTGGAYAYVMLPKEETVKEAKIKLDSILETNKYTTTTKATTTKK